MGSHSRWKGVLRSRGPSTTIAGVLLVTLGLPVLYGAAMLGIGWRAWGGPGSLPSGAPLDYGRGLIGAISPLTERFLQRVLGNVISLDGSVDRAPARDRIATPLGSISPERHIDRHVDDLTNDDVSAARAIPSVPYTAHTDTTRSTRPASDPSDCGSVGGTVWYRFRPATTMLLAAYTFGTDHSVNLGVFTRAFEKFENVDCDSDASGNAFASFQATAGTTYYFQIAAPVEGGRLVFSLDPHGTFVRATKGRDGEPMNGDIDWQPAISEDGRYVAFASFATNMVEGSPPLGCRTEWVHAQPPWTTCAQIYVRDTLAGTTELVSKSPRGEFGDSPSHFPNLSADGRYVVFRSFATNLGSGGDAGGLFVHDRHTGRTESVPSGVCTCITSISDDGRYVAFQTDATLVAQDTNGSADVYVYDRKERSNELASVDHLGRSVPHGGQQDPTLGYGTAGHLGPPIFALPLSPSLSGDGRFVVFRSQSPLVPEDRNGTKADIYLRDRVRRTIERISVSKTGGDQDTGVLGNGTGHPTISDEGRYVVYVSAANNVVDGDTDDFSDIFVRDRVAKKNILASGGFNSVGYSGQVPIWASISGDGRFVSYESNTLLFDGVLLVQEIGFEINDVYRYDVLTDTTSILTQTIGGEDSWGGFSRVSGDGQSVVFMSGDPRYDGPTDCTPGGYHPLRCRNIFVYRAPGTR